MNISVINNRHRKKLCFTLQPH